MSVRDLMLLWTYVSFDVVDIRPGHVKPEDRLEYRAPTSLFLVTTGGAARIKASRIDYSSQQAPVAHIAKGEHLHIQSTPAGYEYIMIMYKAQLPHPVPGEMDDPQRAVEQFRASYTAPAEAGIACRSMACEMENLWKQAHPLLRLKVKQQVYAFIHLLLKEMEGQAEAGRRDEDAIDAAVRHMEANYSKPWTLASLAEDLGTNTRQLQRGFKARFGHSPLEHLISIRIAKAKQLLEYSERTISQIAEEVGYPDSYYFSRLFKKYTGISPRSYRQSRNQHRPSLPEDCRISPTSPSHSDIVSAGEGRYDQRENATQAFRALLSLTLLCTGGLVEIDGHLRVPHLRGTLELARRPRRIAVLDNQYADQLLALGVEPVGSVVCTVETGGLPANLALSLGRMARLGTKEQPDLRRLAALEPDLVLCTSFQEHCYTEISGIAPAMMLDRNEDWRLSLLRLGELLGLKWKALQIIDAYNAQLSRLRRRLEDGGSTPTVALIRPRDGRIRLHTGRHRTARLLYSELGLSAPRLAANHTGTSSMIPLEALSELRADRLFVLTDNTNREQTRQYEMNPLWNDVDAVHSGKVRHFDTALWIGYYGPIAMSRVVEEIAEALLQ